jgi:hypothetical protein
MPSSSTAGVCRVDNYAMAIMKTLVASAAAVLAFSSSAGAVAAVPPSPASVFHHPVILPALTICWAEGKFSLMM